MTQTEHTFHLPLGLVDEDGTRHSEGVMRLAKAADEINILRDPRVIENAAYRDVLLFSRVITRLGTLPSVDPAIIEGLYVRDLSYLREFYERINLGFVQPEQ